MIDPAYVQNMARYNAWQNNQLKEALEPLSPAELTKDRGAFFGSIFATLNHILWGDRMWMARFDKNVAAPEKDILHTELTPTFGAWTAERFATDGKLVTWAQRTKAVDLLGPLTWYSGMTKTEQTKPLSLCITHLFNHQTHHRGQVHTMMTAAGLQAPVSDLVFMPDAF